METNILKRIGTVVLLAGAISFSGWAQNKEEKNHPLPFYYDNRGFYESMSTQTVCKPDATGKYLELHCKYYFTYDEQNRMIRKEAYKWNEFRETWSPNYILTFTYEHDQIETEYAVWNQRKKDYNSPSEKIIYAKSNQGIVAYNGYKKNPISDEWELVSDLSGLQPSRLGLENDGMLARMGGK